ncbi:MAG: LysR family transcriptional regulator, partial [Acidobacteriales bacterium]
MTLDQIKLFRDIAHSRSVSRGARANNVSQSAASQHIQELERMLGTELLDRSTRPLGMTETGRLYFEFCRDVLRRQQEFEEALNGLKGRVEGTVRVAAIYSVGILDMSRLEQELSRRMPEAQLQVEYLRPEKVQEAVLTDQADLGIISYPESNKEIT